MKAFAVRVFVIVFALLIIALNALAQRGENNLVEPPRKEVTQPKRLSGKVLQELGLTQEQIQKIRAVNQKMRPALRQAVAKLREANRELDEAIYADEVNEAVVTEKLQKLQVAQAEVTRLRIQLELEFRKILTAEQLEKFRQFRQRGPRIKAPLPPM
ncbi:MAG: periplasmic heavy metal sensor [Acidobacteria bacterium]|jgi:Spy/CpxP family protein refolding chaperone|nr:MAG: periplasmic heavy metal sensor [Acidobacteriota bacterium]GIU82778.1 MAG: hypothetical protein KatS3mg006_1842 [Pyrinomonadaceae bacterium]